MCSSLWQLFRQCRYCYPSSKLTKINKMVERVFYHKHMEEFRDKHFLPAVLESDDGTVL